MASNHIIEQSKGLDSRGHWRELSSSAINATSFFDDDPRLSLLKPHTYQPPPSTPKPRPSPAAASVTSPPVQKTPEPRSDRSRNPATQESDPFAPVAAAPPLSRIRPQSPAAPRGAMWPQALRIKKSAVNLHEAQMLSPEEAPVQSKPIDIRKPVTAPPLIMSSSPDLTNSRSDSTSQASARMWSPSHTPQSSNGGSAGRISPATIAVSADIKPQQPKDTLTVAGATKEARRPYLRSRTASPLDRRNPFAEQTTTTLAWRAGSPVKHMQPHGKPPTPPQSPQSSRIDSQNDSAIAVEAADIVIGRQVTVKDRRSSLPEEAMSPTTAAAFAAAGGTSPQKSTRNFSRTRRNDSLAMTFWPKTAPTDAPEKQLPAKPKRRSMSADEATRRTKIASQEAEITVTYRNDSVDLRSIASPSTQRPDRSKLIAEYLRELNTRSSAHFERYTRLRQSRQFLHSEILAVLSESTTRPRGSKTGLQLQIEIATIDASIDDCMSKLAALDKKRQRLTEELLLLTQASPPSATLVSAFRHDRSAATSPGPPEPARPLHSRTDSFLSHSRNASLGVQEMLLSPRAPLSPPPPPPGQPSPLSAGPGAADKMGKRLPAAPRDMRVSSHSLSLANIMDFLDTSEDAAF